MAKRMPFRFTKRFSIFGRFLQGTVSKKGLSLNLRMGPLAKSWGTGRRRSTTVDMPGVSGIFWRSQTKASKSEAVEDINQFWLFISLLLWLISALTLTVRMLLVSGQTSTIGLAAILIGQMIILFLVRAFLGLRRLGSLVAMIILIAGGWLLFTPLVG